MRYQCTICSELFEIASDVAAIPCGHIYHDHCLLQWFEVKRDCPQCRKPVNQKQIIHKLYFDQADEDDGEDLAKLKNDLDNARLALKQKEQEKTDLKEEKRKLDKYLEQVEDSKKIVELMIKEEKMTTAGLRKELIYYKQQMTEADAARQEARRVRKKLETMQAIEAMINSMYNTH